MRAVGLGCGILALWLMASTAVAAGQTGKPEGKEGTAKPPTRVRFLDSGSGESKAAREKRLRRECKGRPNAGACLGMTR